MNLHPSIRPEPVRSIELASLQNGRGALHIGRDGTIADIVLPHPSISRRHASLELVNGELQVVDNGSTNATFVDGVRVQGRHTLREGTRLEIGPYRFVLRRDVLHSEADALRARIDLRDVTLTVPHGSVQRTLVDRVSLSIGNSALTCVLGPSGCGKSTLLSLVAGRQHPSAGVVMVDGVDVHRDFARVKDRIALVPQREALRDELTVADFLRYSARLRLPTDLSRSEADEIILRLVERTGLAERLDARIRTLSGGQRRRLGMINELLGRPSVLLLDEVTSGLDEEAAHGLMELVAEIARDGVTVVCVTHTVGAVEPYADACVLLAPGGVPVFSGSPKDAVAQLGVESLSEIYGPLRTAKRMTNALATATHHADRDRSPSNAGDALRSHRERVPARELHNVRTHALRYVSILLGDPRTLALALGQCLIIGIILRMLFGTAPLEVTRSIQLGSLLAISSFWFGCNNAAKEIVKDQELLRQEWAVGVSALTSLAAKAAVLLVFGTLQALLLLATILVSGVQVVNASAMVGISIWAAAAGTALGLLISAASRSTDAASTTLPIVLIPQLLLSEVLVSPLNEAARILASGTVAAYWLHRQVRFALGDIAINGDVPFRVLALQGVGCTVVAAWLLSRRLRRG